MKYLLILLFSISSFAKLKSENMKFTYRSYDGQINYQCDHKIVNDLANIWDLYCFDESNNLKKKFSTTVRISRYTRTRSPQNTYELIYRITEKPSPTQRIGSGSTHWINLEKDGPLHSLTLSQSVENDTAGVYLEIKY